MVAPVSRKTVADFYAALASRDADRIASFVADQVDWLIIGPVEFLHFCGQRRTRAEVHEVFARLVPEILDVTSYDQDYVLVDGDLVAALGRLTATQRRTRRVVSFRLAHFMRFHDDKIVEYRSLIDTLDAAEQMLGREVDLSAG
jgi:ketosteroid isomerase-like protein